MAGSLFLYEEIMLLALHDEKGTLPLGSTVEYSVAGSLVAEFLLLRRITVDDAKKKLVTVVSTQPIGDQLLDECLERIARSSRRASLSKWISRLAGIKKLKQRAAEPLCERGILKTSQGKALLIFSRTSYPELDPRPERELAERLRLAISPGAAAIDPRTAVLLSLAHHGGLLRNVLPRQERKQAQARIKALIQGEPTGKAAREAVEAMEAAVVAASLAAMVATAD